MSRASNRKEIDYLFEGNNSGQYDINLIFSRYIKLVLMEQYEKSENCELINAEL